MVVRKQHDSQLVIHMQRDFICGYESFREHEQRNATYKVATYLISHFWGKYRDMTDALGVLLLTCNQPCYRYGNSDFDKTENIFIKSDNLDVLKILQKTYQNKIKMIYINLPYNTGNDSFIYPNRFKEEKEDCELRAGIKDAEHELIRILPQKILYCDKKLEREFRIQRLSNYLKTDNRQRLRYQNNKQASLINAR